MILVDTSAWIEFLRDTGSPVCEAVDRLLDQDLAVTDAIRMVLLAGGTGNPFFTTDTTAVLRAAEIGAGAVLKATDVDGVYSADPKKDRKAVRYERLTHDEAIAKDLKVMDTAAFALARESKLSILVGSVHAPSSITDLLLGKVPSTVVVP